MTAATSGAAAEVTVRFFAAAEEAAGMDSGRFAADDIAALRVALTSSHPPLAAVLPRCAFLVDGVRAGEDTRLAEAATVDVLPPFAGG
ncbi:MoaD/ThiS family protein [Microbacterium xanthum]|uniref:MoaD/ThiS family protein n=1 Tax=Microbacterium xanthum TaxID=3079794 RepID=UPI002AD56D5A|nr:MULTISPECIES: MoaD/ThiS family protein [unclassified Microbacterium]MDZ8171838.1 MoaD/ThiS family protein [Microbacterium sp. KSW-48]MDZ8200059.1 MoaD/ThiS family protein [Microbacterium sp. SSW1-59]